MTFLTHYRRKGFLKIAVLQDTAQLPPVKLLQKINKINHKTIQRNMGRWGELSNLIYEEKLIKIEEEKTHTYL